MIEPVKPTAKLGTGALRQRCLVFVNLKSGNIVASKLIWTVRRSRFPAGWRNPAIPNDEEPACVPRAHYRACSFKPASAEDGACSTLAIQTPHTPVRSTRILKDRRGQIPQASRSAKGPQSEDPRHSASDCGGRSVRGSGNSHIATLVERIRRFVLLVELRRRDTAEVVGA